MGASDARNVHHDNPAPVRCDGVLGRGFGDRRYFPRRGGLLMLRTLAISSLLFVGGITVANADVFRWVDDHGGVHYSDQWVPGSEVIKSGRGHPVSTSSNSPRTTS